MKYGLHIRDPCPPSGSGGEVCDEQRKDWTGMTSVWGQQEDQAGKLQTEEKEKEQELEDLLNANEGELPKEENPIAHVGELQQSPILKLSVDLTSSRNS